MISIPGKFYDGKTSRTIEAVFLADTDGHTRVARTEDGHQLVSIDLYQVKISPRLAHTPRHLYFPGGGKFETLDNRSVDTLLNQFGQGGWLNRVHFLEARIKYVLIALMILILFLWAGVRYGVPAAAKVLAPHLPAKAMEYAGTRTLTILDHSFFNPSELGEDRQKNLLDHFQSMTNADLKIRILFRKGGDIGPNAFALPNGMIIFTDEMVRAAVHDDELLAVLAHEMGHLVHHHGMRTLIQDSLLSFALLTLTGDVTGSAELFMGLPVFFTQMAYSRGFELEADQYALTCLRRTGIPPARFADLMERIEQKMAELHKPSDQKWWSYLSTHPDMAQRLKPFRNPEY